MALLVNPIENELWQQQTGHELDISKGNKPSEALIFSQWPETSLRYVEEKMKKWILPGLNYGT